MISWIYLGKERLYEMEILEASCPEVPRMLDQDEFTAKDYELELLYAFPKRPFDLYDAG